MVLLHFWMITASIYVRDLPTVSLATPCLMAQPRVSELRLLSIFVCDQQDQLAHAVYTMTVFRDHCLSLPHGSHIAITNVQGKSWRRMWS
jgi:hypothetical protein